MERLRRLLGVMPAVYLQGARQTGKTTLAKQLLEAGVLRDYVSFDDPLVRTAAQRDPAASCAMCQQEPPSTRRSSFQR
jgi:predicted AAA+ superfamily ATPase